MQQKTREELEELLGEIRVAMTPVLHDYVVDGEVVLPAHVWIAHAVR
jgi:hypothetical protein